MHHKEIVLDGQKIAYYESTGKGHPVLFIHGNSLSSLCFEKQLTSRLGDQFRLVAMDLPGHGRSAPAHNPKSAYSIPAYADIVTKFARALGLEAAVLVGWSLGGHILLETIKLLPQSPGTMIFGAPPVGKPMAPDAFMPNPLMPLLFSRVVGNDQAAALSAEFVLPGSKIPIFYAEDIQRTDGRAREELWVSIGQGIFTDEVKIVAEISGPLAIVQGEKDPLINLGLRIPLQIGHHFRFNSATDSD